MDRKRLTELFEAREQGNVAFLLDGLRDPAHRAVAIAHLGELRPEAAIQPLIPLLRAGDRATRSGAAEVLGKLGAREAVPALLDLASDDRDVVPRTYAITALGALGDLRAVLPLCELLGDESIVVRQSAARALGVLGDPRAIEPLGNFAKRERWYSRGIHKRSIRMIRAAGSQDRHGR